MTGLPERAELLRIAALLNVSPEQLPYLAQFDATALRRFREQATDLLFDANRPRLEGFAAATRLLPTSMAAKISTATVPGSLAGLVAGLLEPGKALDLARKLPASYIADMTPYLDPRRIRPILSRIPADLIAQVAKLLSDRGDYLSIGQVVGLLEDDVVRATIPVVGDEIVLRAGFVMDDDARLSQMVTLLPSARQLALLRVAQEKGLWPEALGVLQRLDPPTRGALAAAAAEDGALLESMLLAAHEQGSWDAAEAVLDSLTPQRRQEFAERASELGLPTVTA